MNVLSYEHPQLFKVFKHLIYVLLRPDKNAIVTVFSLD